MEYKMILTRTWLVTIGIYILLLPVLAHALMGDKLLPVSSAQQKEGDSGSPVGKTYIDPIIGMEFVWAEGGCYKMGCGPWTSNCDNDEKPVHEVCVDGFYIGKYEVTQKLWQRVMGNNPSKFKMGDAYPVEQVSWNDAHNFIRKLNQNSDKSFRLPTEAEWEYAARSGGKKERYAGGNNIDAVAWYNSNSGRSTHAVGTKNPNGLGIYDMSGNVWEWCSDRYDRDYYKNSPRNNPQGPSSGSNHVLRGGSWFNYPGYVRTVDRGRSLPVYRSYGLGLRLVLPAQ